MTQSKEAMIKILDAHTDVFTEEVGGGEYSRTFEATALLCRIKVEWWVNLSYLYVNSAMIPFTDISVDGCWPNKYKNNIRFSNDGDTVCIIPLEEY